MIVFNTVWIWEKQTGIDLVGMDMLICRRGYFRVGGPDHSWAGA